jgi:hypothetical protein
MVESGDSAFSLVDLGLFYPEIVVHDESSAHLRRIWVDFSAAPLTLEEAARCSAWLWETEALVTAFLGWRWQDAVIVTSMTLVGGTHGSS